MTVASSFLRTRCVTNTAEVDIPKCCQSPILKLSYNANRSILQGSLKIDACCLIRLVTGNGVVIKWLVRSTATPRCSGHFDSPSFHIWKAPSLRQPGIEQESQAARASKSNHKATGSLRCSCVETSG